MKTEFQKSCPYHMAALEAEENEKISRKKLILSSERN